MAVTLVGVANEALINIGADRISSLTEDVQRARLINAIFDQTRDEVLASHPWNFALKRATLNPSEETPDSEYDVIYEIPSDCLRVLETPDHPSLDWVVENGQILTDEPDELPVKYIFRQTDPTKWSPLFGTALAWRLSTKVCYALTQSTTLFEACEAKFKSTISMARSMDGAEGIMKNLEADVWTLARR